jgi:predicted extracellular nuclease
VLADNGTGASIRSARGGILLQPDDSNPERIAISYKSGPKYINSGDRLKEPVVGVMNYNTKYNCYQVEIDSLKTSPRDLTPEKATNEAPQGGLSLATFNVESFYPKDPKLRNLSRQIVFNLSLPDIIALEEVGDNNGKKDDAVVAADQTYGVLIQAITDASGVVYNYTNIDPLDDQDGGAPGYNIRVGMLYRTDKGLQLVSRSGGNATIPTTITTDDQGKPHLSYSPGRIDPLDPAFDSSRKPLAAEFIYNDSSLFVIANHLNSKGGDQSIYGANQPPRKPSENQRHKQAQVIRSFVNQILKADQNANIVALGDLNDFQFSETLNILKEGDLIDVIESLAPNQQYTYVYEGNSQALDHILLSRNLSEMGFVADVVHFNSEFANRTSDHDPVVVRIEFP